MVETKTPGDDTIPKGKSHPKRGRSYRILEGGLDYCIYEIVPPGHDHVPAGTLMVIPDIPRFESSAAAMRWIRNDSGDVLAGKQVMVFKALEILNINVENAPKVTITAKPKVQTGGPEKSDG